MEKKKVMKHIGKVAGSSVVLTVAGLSFACYGLFRLIKDGSIMGVKTVKRYRAGKAVEVEKATSE